MKKLLLFVLVSVIVMTSTAVYAAQKAPLGLGNIAVKLDYIGFTEDILSDVDVDQGLFIGLEGYVQLVPALYLGAEVGYANPEGSFLGIDPWGYVAKINSELTFVPIELNLKYAIPATSNLVFDLGAGASYTYVEEEATLFGIVSRADDWLFGGQVFADMNYTTGIFFIGINGKYQITEDFEGGNYSYNNWRVGGQIGVMF